MTFDIRLSGGDNFTAFMQNVGGEAARIVQEEIALAGRALRDEYRQQARQVFRRTGKSGRALGQNMIKTFRTRTYPQGRPSLGAASLVYSTFRHMNVFVTGATINARGGRYLAVPLPAAERFGLDRAAVTRGDFGRFQAGSGARTARIAQAVGRFGDLKIIPIGNGNLMLAVEPDSFRNQGGRASKTQVIRGKRVKRQAVPVFLLLKQVLIRPMFDGDGPAARAIAQVESRLAARL